MLFRSTPRGINPAQNRLPARKAPVLAHIRKVQESPSCRRSQGEIDRPGQSPTLSEREDAPGTKSRRQLRSASRALSVSDVLCLHSYTVCTDAPTTSAADIRPPSVHVPLHPFPLKKFTHASVRSDAPIFAYASKHSGFRRVAGLTLLTGAPLMI